MKRRTSILVVRNPSERCFAWTLALAVCCSGALASCTDTPDPGNAGCVATTEADLRRLGDLENLPDCAIDVRSSALSSLDALQGLKSTNGFILRDNPSLIDVDYISSIDYRLISSHQTPLGVELVLPQAVEEVRVESSEVEVADGAMVAGTVMVWEGNAALRTLRFEVLQDLEALVLDGNSSLVLDDAFPALRSVGELTVVNSPSIPTTAIEALATRVGLSLEVVTHCGNKDDGPCS
jgi:hypothetical protein